MIRRGVFLAAFALITAFLVLVPRANAVLPDYKLGDVAKEDVVTPVRLLVPNPDATEALKQKVGQEVPFIVRLTTQSAVEAETELRASIVSARDNFLAALGRELGGRAPSPADLESPAYVNARREIARDSAKDMPIDKLAPLWIGGGSDEPFIASLLQPLREVMVQPILGSKAENPFPAGQQVRLIPVKTLREVPTLQELENTGQTVSAGKVISLWRARRMVETYYPVGQDRIGKFVASFVRNNAYPEPGLTGILRAKRLEGVTVNDTYDAAQAIVKKGQTIDRRALSALAGLREKSLIGTLQTKLEQEQSFAVQITKQTKVIAASLGAVVLVLVLILWRLRARPAGMLLPVPANQVLMDGSEPRALPESAGEDAWRSRAMLAEGKAERAHEAMRSGALSWMRERIFQTLFHQRATLLSAQQKAEAEMRVLAQRLEQLHTPLQERISAYEKRIAELEQDLAAKGEENRELIGAQINVAKQHLTAERGRFGSN